MPIPVECEGCFSPFEIPSKFAGKKIRCKVCGETMRVPSASEIRERSLYGHDNDDYASTMPGRELPPRKKSTSSKGRKKKSRSTRHRGASRGGMSISATLVIAGVFLLLLPLALFVSFVAKAYFFLALFAAFVLYVWGRIELLIVGFEDGLFPGLCSLFLNGLYIIYMALNDWARVSRPIFRLLSAAGIVLMATVVAAVQLPSDESGIAELADAPRQQQVDGGQLQPGVGQDDHTFDDSSPYPVDSIKPDLPAFPGGFSEVKRDGFEVYLSKSRRRTPGKIIPGEGTMFRVYLPEGEHADRSLPCVLVPPAGSTLLTGLALDSDVQHPEHLPYVRAGYAVVTFSIDGLAGDFESAKDAEIAFAHEQFKDAFAGLVNARAAFRFAKRKLTMVDQNRIYIAGHSSAATLALLYAAHEPELAGCLAYAPAADVESQLAVPVQRIEGTGTSLFPGLKEFSRRSSPKTHASRVQCPVFVYHASGDTVTPYADTQAYCDVLKRQGKDVTFVTGTGDDHYQTMIDEGIPAGLEWLAERVKMPVESRRSRDIASNTAPFSERQPLSIDTIDREKSKPLTAKRPVKEPPVEKSPAKEPEPPVESEETPPPNANEVVIHNDDDPPLWTMPLDPDTDLKLGMKVIAKRAFTWESAEVLAIGQRNKVLLHYYGLPSGFDDWVSRSELHLQRPVDQLDDRAIRTAVFQVRENRSGGRLDEAAIAEEYLSMEGYIHDSLKIDHDRGRISVQVIRGTHADTYAKNALLGARAFADEVK